MDKSGALSQSATQLTSVRPSDKMPGLHAQPTWARSPTSPEVAHAFEPAESRSSHTLHYANRVLPPPHQSEFVARIQLMEF